MTNIDPDMSTEHATYNIWRLVSAGLLKWNVETGAVEPDVAQYWDTPDSRTYIFHLRQGVRFQNIPPVNGREVTADDVIYSINRMATKDPKFPNKAGYNPSWVESMTAPDKYTLKIVLKQPNSSFLTVLANEYLVIIAKEDVEQYGDLKNPKALIGCGPFIANVKDQFDITTGGTLVRNPDYFIKGLPYLDAIQEVLVADPATMEAALVAGNVDIGQISFNDWDTIQARNPNLNLYGVDYARAAICGFGMNASKPPFNDVRVRKAIALATDAQEIGMTAPKGKFTYSLPVGVLPGWMLPTDQLVQIPGYRHPKDADIAQARQLLADAGYPTGFTVQCNTTSSYPEVFISQALVLQPQLAKIGVKLNINTMEYGAFVTMYSKKDFDSVFISMNTTNDPVMCAYNFLDSKGSRNYWNYSDPTVDQLIESQFAITDQKQRQQSLYDMQKELLTYGLPFVYTMIPQYAVGAYNYVVNYKPTYHNLAWKYIDVWLDK